MLARRVGKGNPAAGETFVTTARADGRIATNATGRRRRGRAADEARLEAAEADVKICTSTGKEEIRADIPCEHEGQKALFQCIAKKRNDGSFRVVFQRRPTPRRTCRGGLEGRPSHSRPAA